MKKELTRIWALSTSLWTLCPFLSFSAHSVVNLALTLLTLSFNGCLAPQILHILHATRICCMQDMQVFMVEPGILTERKKQKRALAYIKYTLKKSISVIIIIIHLLFLLVTN